MTARVLFAGLALGGAIAHSQSTDGEARPLIVGDPAPPMKVGKWVKGAPFSTFKRGQAYVVEFWATWCGPCRKSIPHLTDLQKRYGTAVAFTGVAISQTEAKSKYVGVVAEYVKAMGMKMEYGVAVDTEPSDGAMARRWMAAARQNGIPTAFVVGKDGTIAWIGHPMDVGLTTTLDAIVAGTFDAAAARSESQKRWEVEQAMSTAFAKVFEAYKRGDDAAAETILVDFSAKYPMASGTVLSMRFNRHLEQKRGKEAVALLRTEWENPNLSSDDLNGFAWDLLTSKEIAARDYPLAIAIAAKAVALTNESDANVIDTLALAYFESGDTKQAIAWQEKAVKLTKGQDEEMNATLEKYRKGRNVPRN